MRAPGILITDLQVGKNILHRRLTCHNGHGVSKGVLILFADSDIPPGHIHELIVERKDTLHRNDRSPVDPAEQVGRQDPLPLLQAYEHHDRPVRQHQAGVILTGFNTKDTVKIDFYISAFLANKEKRLHDAVDLRE